MHVGVAILLALAVAGCASIPPEPANRPAQLTDAERRGRLVAPYSEVIEPAGQAQLENGAVVGGGDLMTFSYRYRHTAVLTEDVVGFSIAVRGVQAPAGSPGYYAGTFSSVLMLDGRSMAPFGGPTTGDELWCFLPSAAGGGRDHLCLLLNEPSLAAIAPTRLNPYLWDEFNAPRGTQFNYVTTPIYERRSVEIPGDLTFALEFRGWTATHLQLREKAAGRQVRDLSMPREPDGSALIETVVSRMRIAPDPDNAASARITHSN